MPQKSNHDFKEKYPYKHTGPIEPMRIEDIFTKHWFFAGRMPAFQNTRNAHNDIKFGKEVKTIMVVDS